MIRRTLLVVLLLILVSPFVLARPVAIELTEIYRTTGGGPVPTGHIKFGMEKNFSEVNFQARIAHHHSAGNNMVFNLYNQTGDVVYTAPWFYWAVGATVEATLSLENTIARNLSYSGYFGSHSPGFGWLEVRMVPVKIRRSITHETQGDGIADYGFVDALTGASDASNFFRVSTSTPGVLVWLGPNDEDPTQLTTTNPGDILWACLDTNNNRKCDVKEQEFIDCEANGFDWNSGYCCGSDYTDCGFVSSVNAICGKNINDEWEWVPLAGVGEIHEMNCPDASIVPDSVDFNSCGEEFGGLLTVFDDFKQVTFANFMHEYSCENEYVEECRGEDIPFSSINSFNTGDISSKSDDTYYCASDGDWTTDLDIKDDISCSFAGFRWTGSLCCSEEDDPGEYYNDLFASGPDKGGCWDKTLVKSGYPVDDNLRDVINYNGSFYGCHLDTAEDPRLALQDYHTQAALIDNSIEFCGYVLPDAAPGDKPHAFCHTDGTWHFREEVGGTIEKNIGWSSLVDTSEMQVTGCCASNQCWDGETCKPVGGFQRIDDTGFECQQPDPEQDALWEVVPIKYSWDLAMANICLEDSQCLLHIQGNPDFNGDGERWYQQSSDPTIWPKCMNDSQYILDFRCENGDWTTRTKNIGLQLLQFAEDTSGNDYTLFCGSYEQVLNQYQYTLQNVFVKDYLIENCPLSGSLVPCVNNLCVLKTSNSIGIGASLNTEVDNSQHSFLKAIGKNANLCNNKFDDTDTEFVSCSQDVWYNPDLNSIIYLPGATTLSTPDVSDLITDPTESITDYVMEKLHSPPTLSFGYYPKTRLFNNLYLAQKGNRVIFGFKEDNLIPESEGNPIPIDYIGVRYTDNIYLGSNPCLNLIKKFDSTARCENQTEIGFDVIAEHRAGAEPSPIVDVWPALTGKLRP